MTDIQQFRDILAKFSSGTVQLADQICAALAESSVFVLLSEPLRDDATSGSTVVRVAFRAEGVFQSAYVFLDTEAAISWCELESVTPHLAEMNGADVCVALPRDTVIRLDPGYPHAITLSPQMVVKTSSFGYSTSSKASSQMPNSEPLSSVPVKRGDDGLAAPLAQLAPLARHIPRGHPTTFVAAPLPSKRPGDGKLNTGRPKTYTSSNLKKIIRNPGAS